MKLFALRMALVPGMAAAAVAFGPSASADTGESWGRSADAAVSPAGLGQVVGERTRCNGGGVCCKNHLGSDACAAVVCQYEPVLCAALV